MSVDHGVNSNSIPILWFITYFQYVKIIKVGGGNMKINISDWLHNLSSAVLVTGLAASMAISGLPIFSQIEFYITFWVVIVPIWVLSLILFVLLRALKAHLSFQKSILERLNQNFKVEEQKRVEDPLSRF